MNKRCLRILLCFILLAILTVVFVGCKCNDGDETPNCTVTLDKTELSLTLGESYTLTAKTTGASESPLTWTTSDDKIVSVVDGKVVSLKIGQVEVVATYGDASAKCVVNSGLGNFLPTLGFSTNDEELVLAQGQVFEILPKLTFNGVDYNDFTFEVSGEKTAVDYTVDDNVIKVTANTLGEQNITVKATWNGLNADSTPTLIKTIKIKVISDFNFSVNGGGVENVELYTCSTFEGQTYTNQIPFIVKAVKNGVEVSNANVAVNVVDETVAKIESGVLTALKSGTTAIELSYADGDITYTNTINVKVIKPVADYPTTFDYFSSLSGTYKDLKTNCDKSIIEEIFGDDSSKIIFASSGETELTVEDGKILGVVGANDKAEQKTIYIETTEYCYNVNLIVYGKYITTADDLTEIFGKDNAKSDLKGYFVLGNDIDATTAIVDGGLRFDNIVPGSNMRYRFRGTFDGKGHVISNLNISGASNNIGALFGQIGSGAIIKNVAFINVLARNAAIIASNSYQDYSDKPQVSNVYVKVNSNTTDFRGLFNQGSAIVNNTLVEYANAENATGVGAFAGGKFSGFDKSSDNYVISLTPVTNHTPTGADAPVTEYDFVKKFESETSLKEAVLDLSSFDANYWVTKDGVPVWKNTLSVSVLKNTLAIDGKIYLDNTTDVLTIELKDKYGTAVSNVVLESASENLVIEGNTVKLKNAITNINDNAEYTLVIKVVSGAYSGYTGKIVISAEKAVTKDTKSRAYSIMDETLDLSGLGFTLADVSNVEINGVKLSVASGKLPTITLKIDNKNRIKLTVDGLTEDIILVKDETAKDFTPIALRLFHKDGEVYDLLNVQVYTKVLMDSDDLTEIFGSTGELTGYYVLGQNITANSKKSYGRTSQKFKGIFDGFGHVVTNVNLYSNNVGSLFGELNDAGCNAAVIRNVAFENMKVNRCALVYNSAKGGSGLIVPSISNVYISLNSTSTTFVGIVFNPSFVTINNCIVVDTRAAQTEMGSFIGQNITMKSGSANNYVISKTPLFTGLEDSAITCAKRYEDLSSFKTAVTTQNLNFSSFSTDYWTITDGIPVWTKLN